MLGSHQVQKEMLSKDREAVYKIKSKRERDGQGNKKHRGYTHARGLAETSTGSCMLPLEQRSFKKRCRRRPKLRALRAFEPMALAAPATTGSILKQ